MIALRRLHLNVWTMVANAILNLDEVLTRG